MSRNVLGDTCAAGMLVCLVLMIAVLCFIAMDNVDDKSYCATIEMPSWKCVSQQELTQVKCCGGKWNNKLMTCTDVYYNIVDGLCHLTLCEQLPFHAVNENCVYTPIGGKK